MNPWRLQAWLGHSTITMTMRYVHHVEEHHRPVPATILAAGATIMDPDARVMAMLGRHFPHAQFLITGVLGPHSNAHGPNEFLHIPTAERISVVIAQVLADHHAQQSRR